MATTLEQEAMERGKAETEVCNRTRTHDWVQGIGGECATYCAHCGAEWDADGQLTYVAHPERVVWAL